VEREGVKGHHHAIAYAIYIRIIVTYICKYVDMYIYTHCEKGGRKESSSCDRLCNIYTYCRCVCMYIWIYIYMYIYTHCKKGGR